VIHVFITYRLRKGASRENYRQWSREVDQVVLIRQPDVIRYTVCEVVGTAVGEPSCDFVEDIQVESREAWEKVNDYPDMQPVVKQWLEFCDPDSVKVVYGATV
jgi:hypothetical protein